jgi:hypothetical protein
MTPSPRHQLVEDRMRELLTTAGLPAPDDIAHVSRAVIFLWYETKAFVLVDLDEMPDGDDPLDGLDVGQLAIDLDEGLTVDDAIDFIEAA